MSAPVADIASTIQSASIQKHPDPHYDLNPSTAASQKEPVTLGSSPAASDVAEDEIPLSALHPRPRRKTLPPLPDLRFEQSYLKSIEKAESWQGVAYITIRDQVFLPLTQGILWTLILSGWRFWNRETKLKGHSVGARIRRWWWGVNNWNIPSSGPSRLDEKRLAGDFTEMLTRMLQAYQAEFANAGTD